MQYREKTTHDINAIKGQCGTSLEACEQMSTEFSQAEIGDLNKLPIRTDSTHRAHIDSV